MALIHIAKTPVIREIRDELPAEFKRTDLQGNERNVHEIVTYTTDRKGVYAVVLVSTVPGEPDRKTDIETIYVDRETADKLKNPYYRFTFDNYCPFSAILPETENYRKP